MSASKSFKGSMSIPPTEMFGEEQQKYMSLTRIFLCKVIECIYCNRCPKELSDFTFDEDRWFSLDIPKSSSLRELVSRRANYGWFQIDVSITDLEMIVERWILIHEEVGTTESRPLLTGKNRELRHHTFRRYSQILRSIYSMLDALPVKTLELCLGHISGTNRRITAVCSHFRTSAYTPEEFTDQDKLEVDFGPVITPFGKVSIRCTTIKNIEMFIPRILENNTTPSQSKISIRNDVSFQQDSDTDNSIWLYSFQQPEFESEFSDGFIKRSFTPDSMDDKSNSVIDQQLSIDVATQTPEEFLDYINSLSVEFPDELDEDKAKQIFNDLSAEIKDLFDEWMQLS